MPIVVFLPPLIVAFFFFVALQGTNLHWSLKILFSFTPFVLWYFASIYGLLFSALIAASIMKSSG